MQRLAALKVPGLVKTMSSTAPDTADAIRSAVTGALTQNANGLFCFERTVETTFVLPWDLNPTVEPEKISVKIRDGIRNELMDLDTLNHLEASQVINWSSLVIWQWKDANSSWSSADVDIANQLEKIYVSSTSQASMTMTFGQLQIDLVAKKVFNPINNLLLDCRRLAFSPMIPMKTERDQFSLFHAASLGFWGVHDRTSLLQNAVAFTLIDSKAQIMFYSRWYNDYQQSTPPNPTKGLPQWEQAKMDFKVSPQLHIFTLANIVQRPIIVYAHPDSPVGGIYLPLLWVTPENQYPCDQHPELKTPLALAYNAMSNHFTPLVTFRGPKGPCPVLLPLVYANGKVFKIHYLNDTEAQVDKTQLLLKFLSIDILTDLRRNVPILTAVMDIPELPDAIDSLIKSYQSRFL